MASSSSSSSDSDSQMCYLLVALFAVGILIWGFVELLKPSSKLEQLGTNDKGNKVTVATVSRQIRGLAIIVLAYIVLAMGMAVCGPGGPMSGQN